MARPTRAAEPIEITYRRVGDRYVFASADYKVLISDDDQHEVAARFVRLADELRCKGAVILFRVEAYAPLGPQRVLTVAVLGGCLPITSGLVSHQTCEKSEMRRR